MYLSRKHRIWYPGAIYHVTGRGNRRAAIFYDDHDYSKYLSLLSETQQTYPFQLHAFCLMPNHLHLLLETTDTNIRDIMWSIQTPYARYINKKYDLVGHVFQGRYGAELIDSQRYFIDTSRYIHLNPYKASLVVDPADYPWSSYYYYRNLITPPPILNTTITLSLFSEPSNYYLLDENELEIQP